MCFILMLLFRSMDREGCDANITSQGFGSLAYGSTIQSNISNLTLHGSVEKIEPATVSMSRYPDSVFKVELKSERMDVMDGLTRRNKKCKIKIPNFHTILTESDPEAEIQLRVVDKKQQSTEAQTTEQKAEVVQTTTTAKDEVASPGAEGGASVKQEASKEEKIYRKIINVT